LNPNFSGLGDEWGAAPPPNNPLEAAIKELGSHLLQVRERHLYSYQFILTLT